MAVLAQGTALVSHGEMVGCIPVKIVATSAADASPDEPYAGIDEHGVFEAGFAVPGDLFIDHSDGMVGSSRRFSRKMAPGLLFTDDRI